MHETDLYLMSLVIFLPSVFAIALMCVPRGKEEMMRWIALFGTAITMALSLWLFIDYLAILDTHQADPSQSTLASRAEAADAKAAANDPQSAHDLVGRVPWISQFNIDYFLGIDGISMPLILLTTLICFISMIASWKIDRHVRGYLILFLFLETGMIGTFMALDFFLFYIFWEVMLLPMYFLIGVWGGARREYAAVKFFIYTLLGSVLILIALLGFYFTDTSPFVSQARMANSSGVAAGGGEYNTFDLLVLAKAGKTAKQINDATETVDGEQVHLVDMRDENGQLTEEAAAKLAKETNLTPEQVTHITGENFYSSGWQIAFFVLLFIGFAIKVPVFPFHTWLPDAHVEAPTPISMILAGILLKMGGYGILRIAYPICPWAAYTLAWYVALFGVINIVYGAFAAMAQTDFKKLVAYSSISHMGYVILGIAVWSTSTQYWSWGMNGAMFQMIGHGISSAGMFFLVGVIYDRAHHRNLDNFRGLYEPMPLYGGISAVIFFAALGLPGLCGFVGEFMVVLSTWNYEPVFAILAALTVVITAAYILWTLQRVYFGTNPAYKDYKDINFREFLCIMPLTVLAIVLGIIPSIVLYWMEPHVTGLVDQLVQR